VDFKQSEVDPCLFTSEKVICLVYVKDTLFFSPNESDIDMVLRKLRELQMELSIEDNVAGFLGVLIKKLDEGSIELTQAGLIKRILESMGIEGANPKSTPAEKEALPSDKTGSITEPPFNYASVIVMLQYLCTRPDISFAESQCSQYMHCHTCWKNQKFKFKISNFELGLDRTYEGLQIQKCKLTMTRTQIAKQTHVDHNL